MIIESYRWVGDIMKQQLNGVKPVQMTELETEFEKVEGKAKPERFLRSQMPLPGAAGGAGGDDGGETGLSKSYLGIRGNLQFAILWVWVWVGKELCP